MVGLILVFVILALLFGGFGFALHFLFWIAGVALIVAIVMVIVNTTTRE